MTISASTPNLPKGFASRLAAMPTSSGVYMMKGADAAILYIGKAANLRNRVRSYFQALQSKEAKIRVLVSKISDFEFIVTESVQEALLLENLLIKQHKPFYNARLKDDKTYPYIKIDLKEEFPQVYFTRRVLADGARYFGPFASASSVRKTMDLLKKLFPYRSCTKVITGMDERPCLEYYIHRCVAPCTGEVDSAGYGEVIGQVLHFLEGDYDRVERELQGQMAQASQVLEFEKAALLRNQLRAIESVSQHQKVVSNREEDADVIALASDTGETWVELFKVRHGKLIERDHFLMEGGEAEDESTLMEHFVQQFYESSTDLPAHILLQHPIEDSQVIARWLTRKKGRRVAVAWPQRGEKRRLVQMAAGNALEALTQRRIQWLSQSDRVLQALIQLQESFSLARTPTRIECYDISNTQGSNSVGSMVVFENGRPKRQHYRRFQIREVKGIDDFASMQEMLRRRFRRLGDDWHTCGQVGPELPSIEPAGVSSNATPSIAHVRSTISLSAIGQAGEPVWRGEAISQRADNSQMPPTSFESIPDLVIIDGGKGHLNAAQQVFLELGLTDIPLSALAKQEEEVFLPHMAEPVILPRNSQGLYLIQRIRDEAHRFAVTYHRQRRSRAATRSVLDDVPGIGPKKRRALIQSFGSVAGIRAADIGDIAKIPGMTSTSAQRLMEFLAGR